MYKMKAEDNLLFFNLLQLVIYTLYVIDKFIIIKRQNVGHRNKTLKQLDHIISHKLGFV